MIVADFQTWRLSLTKVILHVHEMPSRPHRPQDCPTGYYKVSSIFNDSVVEACEVRTP